MPSPTARDRPCPVHHRLEAILLHVNWYLFAPVARLARDAGVSHSALSRVLSGRAAPSFALAWKVTHALERRLGAALPGGRLDPREVFSLDGTYPTASVCELVGCPGCKLAQPTRRR